MIKKRFKYYRNNDGTPMIYDREQHEYYFIVDFDNICNILNNLYENNQALQRHIERSTFNKIKVEDVFNCAKYDRFYDNEEAIKSIDWIAKELGVDFE